MQSSVWKRWIAALVAMFALLPLTAASATLMITGRSAVADGCAFGPAGAYEKIVGTMNFKLDPTDPRSAAIPDLDKNDPPYFFVLSQKARYPDRLRTSI